MIRNRYLAAVNDKPWWLAGGIPASACVVAYQAVGASSYEASKVNLANPGLYTAADIIAPLWDSMTGWQFIASSTQSLEIAIGVIRNQNTSAVVKFSDVNTSLLANHSLFGYYSGIHHTMMMQIEGKNSIGCYNGAHYPAGYISNAPVMTGGVYAISGRIPYRNGIKETNMIAASTRTTTEGKMRIGVGVNTSQWFEGYIQAIAFYVVELTQTQVAALTNAMNAL